MEPIKYARLLKGLSQYQLARRVGCGQRDISLLERGLLPDWPSTARLRARVLEALDLPPDPKRGSS